MFWCLALFCIKSLLMANVFLGAGQEDLAFQVAVLTLSLAADPHPSVHQHCQSGNLNSENFILSALTSSAGLACQSAHVSGGRVGCQEAFGGVPCC